MNLLHWIMQIYILMQSPLGGQWKYLIKGILELIWVSYPNPRNHNLCMSWKDPWNQLHFRTLLRGLKIYNIFFQGQKPHFRKKLLLKNKTWGFLFQREIKTKDLLIMRNYPLMRRRKRERCKGPPMLEIRRIFTSIWMEMKKFLRLGELLYPCKKFQRILHKKIRSSMCLYW